MEFVILVFSMIMLYHAVQTLIEDGHVITAILGLFTLLIAVIYFI